MIKEKQKEEDKALSFKYKARDIPKHVKDRKFERLMRQSEERRKEVKRQAMAKIKQTEAPFSFYEKDVEKQKQKKEQAELPPDMAQPAPFRAGKIPWRILVPLYKTMVDDDEQERKRRIKSNAELSLRMSKLPPNMEAQERRKSEKKERQSRSASYNGDLTFKPPAPKEVPDFKKL